MSLPGLEHLESAIAAGELGGVIATLREGDETARLLARALARQRSALEGRPAMALPAVYQLGWFAEPLRPTLTAWLETFDRPWLRSLRRPALPLEAGIDLEIRGVEAAPVWFSADGLVLGAGDRAWEIETGRRIDRARPPPRRRRYRLADCRERDEAGLSPSWGKLPLIDTGTGELAVIEVDDDSSFDWIDELPGGDVIAGGWFMDYDGVVVRIQPSDGAVIWRAHLARSVSGLSVSSDGTRILASGHTALDSATGEILVIHPEARGAAALAPDNRRLASLAGSTLRLWSLDALDWPRPEGVGGLHDAMFSPDGSLLLSGSSLRDAVTGQAIATLYLETGEYLEGGPAEGCTAVVNDGVIEASVFRGFQRWNRLGERVLCDEQRRYWIGDRLWIAPGGERYAVRSRRDPDTVEIRAVTSGVLLDTIGRRIREIAWSPDSRRLAAIDDAGRVFLDGEPLGVHPGAREIAFSIDGAALRTRVDREAAIWPVESTAFRARAHDLTGSLEAGLFVVRDGGEPIAAIPSDEPLEPSPAGDRWAGRTSCYALERPRQ